MRQAAFEEFLFSISSFNRISLNFCLVSTGKGFELAIYPSSKTEYKVLVASELGA